MSMCCTRQRFIMIRLCADAKCDPSALATDLTHEMQFDFGHKIDPKIARKLVCLSRGFKVKDSAQAATSTSSAVTSACPFFHWTGKPPIQPIFTGLYWEWEQRSRTGHWGENGKNFKYWMGIQPSAASAKKFRKLSRSPIWGFYSVMEFDCYRKRKIAEVDN